MILAIIPYNSTPQAKSIPVVLPSFQIKIWGKQRLQLYLYIDYAKLEL